MNITYEVGDFTDDDKSVEVIYTDEAGLTHNRSVNLPRNEDGTLDQEYFDEILEGQLRGVLNKLRVRAIEFMDPNAEEEDEASTEPETTEETQA